MYTSDSPHLSIPSPLKTNKKKTLFCKCLIITISAHFKFLLDIVCNMISVLITDLQSMNGISYAIQKCLTQIIANLFASIYQVKVVIYCDIWNVGLTLSSVSDFYFDIFFSLTVLWRAKD